MGYLQMSLKLIVGNTEYTTHIRINLVDTMKLKLVEIMRYTNKTLVVKKQNRFNYLLQFI